MKALLTNYHQSPRKVGLVADLIRGKSVVNARQALMFLPKKSGPAISKLLESAVANARSVGATADNLFVKTIMVNKGKVMRRSRPFARGRAGSVRKTMSIIFLELGTTNVGAAKKSKGKAATSKKPKKELVANA